MNLQQYFTDFVERSMKTMKKERNSEGEEDLSNFMDLSAYARGQIDNRIIETLNLIINSTFIFMQC